MDYLVSVLDPNILFWIQQHVVNSTLTPVMIGLSTSAKAGGIWIILGLFLCLRKEHRQAGIAVLAALICVAVIGDGLLKHVVMRLRPCIDYPWVAMAIPTPAATDFSFPSCHSYGSFAAAAVLFVYRKKWGIPALFLAAAIGFSRLYLFVHYPTDVAVGAFLGLATGVAAYRMVTAVLAWRQKKVEEYKHLETYKP